MPFRPEASGFSFEALGFCLWAFSFGLSVLGSVLASRLESPSFSASAFVFFVLRSGIQAFALGIGLQASGFRL